MTAEALRRNGDWSTLGPGAVDRARFDDVGTDGGERVVFDRKRRTRRSSRMTTSGGPRVGDRDGTGSDGRGAALGLGGGPVSARPGSDVRVTAVDAPTLAAVPAVVAAGGPVKAIDGFGYAITGTALLATLLEPSATVVVGIPPMLGNEDPLAVAG